MSETVASGAKTTESEISRTLDMEDDMHAAVVMLDLYKPCADSPL